MFWGYFPAVCTHTFVRTYVDCCSLIHCGIVTVSSPARIVTASSTEYANICPYARTIPIAPNHGTYTTFSTAHPLEESPQVLARLALQLQALGHRVRHFDHPGLVELHAVSAGTVISYM